MQIAKFGRWAFIFGIIVAILLGSTSFNYSSIVLVLLGLVVGFMNVTTKESIGYLVAVIALLVIGFSGLQVFSVVSSGLFDWAQNVLTSFIVFVASSGLIVALKEVVTISRD